MTSALRQRARARCPARACDVRAVDEPDHRGIFVATIAVVLIVALENDRAGLTKRVLSSAPLTYLGRISYGVYLWHWPVIVIVAHGRHLDPLELFAIATPLATALAAISFQLLEHPIRTAHILDRYRTPVIALGVTTSILLGVLVMPAVLNTTNTSLAALASADRAKPGPKLLDWRAAAKDYEPLSFHDCLGKSVDVCTVVKGTGPHIVLVGDSIARMWIPAFTELAAKESLTFSVATYAGCPWQQGLNYDGAQAIRTACTAHQNDWYGRVIPQLQPDVVFLAQHAYDDPRTPEPFVLPNGKHLRSTTKDFESTLADVSATTLRTLHRPGRRIVFLEPIPVPSDNPLICLSRGKPVSSCAFTASAGPDSIGAVPPQGRRVRPRHDERRPRPRRLSPSTDLRRRGRRHHRLARRRAPDGDVRALARAEARRGTRSREEPPRALTRRLEKSLPSSPFSIYLDLKIFDSKIKERDGQGTEHREAPGQRLRRVAHRLRRGPAAARQARRERRRCPSGPGRPEQRHRVALVPVCRAGRRRSRPTPA